MNDSDLQSWFAKFEKLLAEKNRRLSSVESSLRLISIWLFLILLVLIIEYGDDVRAAFKGWFDVIRMMLKD